MMEESSVADPDPGSGIGCLFDPWIRDLDPESGIWIRNPGSGSGIRDLDPESGMNNPDHIF
jgi:hypothetical protein